MTPAALTPAADRQTRRSEPGAAPRRPALSRSAATPRSSPRSAGHRPASAPRSAGTTPRPRRVSGPAAAPRAPRRPATRTVRTPPSLHPAVLGARAGALIRSLPTHLLLDRVVRGRAWIPLLGLLLAGIVATQVEILKLSAATGRSLEQVTALQSRNEQLRADVAVLGDDQRIERLAAGMGMVMPGPSQVRFLNAHGTNVGQALSAVRAPSATTFLAALPSAPTVAGGVTTAASQAGAPASPAAPSASAPPAASAVSTSTGSGAPVAGAAATVPTAASATNTGVATTSAPTTGTATGTAAPASSAPLSPSASSSNGAAGVPTGG